MECVALRPRGTTLGEECGDTAQSVSRRPGEGEGPGAEQFLLLRYGRIGAYSMHGADGARTGRRTMGKG